MSSLKRQGGAMDQSNGAGQKRRRMSNESEGDDEYEPLYNPPAKDSPPQDSAEQVAADFKDSLQDLHENNRYHIQTLTGAAKEHTEHAEKLCSTLEAHIRTTPPTRKLPALYVLDSIVKNVGTPYTIYLGRNLYKTFMDAYTLVDNQTRKAMEGMLKTWKEPMPGSIDSRPVFPPNTTRPIENALLKAKTVFVQEQHKQQQQQQARFQQQYGSLPGRPALAPQSQQWRDTSTPPLNYPNTPTPQANFHGYASPPPNQGFSPPNAEFQYGFPQPPSQNNFAYPPQYPQNHTPQPTQMNPATQPSLPSSSGPTFQNNNLAALLQTLGGQPTLHSVSQPPQNANLTPTFAPAPLSTPQPPSSVPADLKALLQSLTPQPAHAATSSLAPPVPMNQANQSTTPATTATAPNPPTTNANTVNLPAIDVPLNATSLKMQRPQLVHMLYEMYPSQCGTCGRRFLETQEGKERKGRHLDWHFRTNQRLRDAALRGVSRNWYADEMDWIKAREIDDADVAPETASRVGGEDVLEGADSGTHQAEGGARSTAEKYIKAPSDASLAHYACPICQDEFKSVWHDKAQDWVWMDAVVAGGRIYHASCLEELTKDRASTPVPPKQRATISSSLPGLGKTKAET